MNGKQCNPIERWIIQLKMQFFRQSVMKELTVSKVDCNGIAKNSALHYFDGLSYYLTGIIYSMRN